MILRLKNDQYQCLWWQLAAYFAKNSAKNDWFFRLCSNVQTVWKWKLFEKIAEKNS